MKSESGFSLLEILFCLTLISITLLGVMTARNQAMQSMRKIQQAEQALLLAENKLRYWQYCGAVDASASIETCHFFDDISGFSQDIPPYSITVKVTPVSFSGDGFISLKKVQVEVSWETGDKDEKVQKIELTSAFSRRNIFNSLH